MKLFSKILITALIAGLSVWALRHGWLERKIHFENYSYADGPADWLKHFPQAMYDYGKHWEVNLDHDSARGFFQKAAAANVFDGDAWMALAETEARLGNTEKAKQILLFLDELAAGTVRWKWEQVLLARELGLENLFFKNVHFLMEKKQRLQDIIQILDYHAGRNPEKCLSFLQKPFYPAYLKWLMRWNRTNDAIATWRFIHPVGDKELAAAYRNFLIKEKFLIEAAKIQKEFFGTGGMVNPGFEDPLANQGFGWRHWGENREKWTIEQDTQRVQEGKCSLRVVFKGNENLNFHHLYQIVPVAPQTYYRLLFTWRSRDITTDQGPFVEISAYDVKGFYVKSPMITGTYPWTKQEIEFETPEECNAIVVRLRRYMSRRFDNKIRGDLWLDAFRLEKTAGPERGEIPEIS